MSLLHELDDLDLDISSKIKGRNRKGIDRKDRAQRKEEGHNILMKNKEIHIRENDAYLWGLIYQYQETSFSSLVSGVIAMYKDITDPSFDKEEIGKMVDDAVNETEAQDPELTAFMDWDVSTEPSDDKLEKIFGEQRNLRSKEEFREIHETEEFGHQV